MGVRSGALVRRRQLARILREMRQKAGFTIEAAAPQLDFSPSKLSRIENAHQGVDVHVVRTQRRQQHRLRRGGPLPGGGMAVRDTKDRARDAHHHHSAPAWQAFLTEIRAGEFSR